MGRRERITLACRGLFGIRLFEQLRGREWRRCGKHADDGGCHYHLSANPGTVISQNYCEGKGSGLSGVVWGEYEDEGSAYLTITKNVYANFGYYVTANANASNDTGHLTFTDNWGSSASPGLNGPANVVMGNVAINGDNFPADAQVVVTAAGLEAAYADLKANP